MKSLFLLSLMATSIFATELIDLPKEECKRQCEIHTYTFTPDFMGNCRQLELCNIFEWNAEESQCEVVELDKFVSYTIACRDIPPY